MEHEQIIKIDNHDAYDPTITVSIKSLEKNGQEQYENYVRDVLETGSTTCNKS